MIDKECMIVFWEVC